MTLSDGRIAVGGLKGFCAIVQVAHSIRETVANLAAQLYRNASLEAQRYPLRAAWKAVQYECMSLTDARKLLVTAENCSRSPDE